MKPYTFADGTTIPKGAILALPIAAIQTDDNFYPKGKEFDGFRFSKLREQKGESAKHHSSNTGAEYLHFGHGQHAWYEPSLLYFLFFVFWTLTDRKPRQVFCGE